MNEEIDLSGPSFIVGLDTYVKAPKSYLEMAALGTPVAVRQIHFDKAGAPALGYIVCQKASNIFVLYFDTLNEISEVPMDWIYVTTGTMRCRQIIADDRVRSAGASSK